MNDFAGFTPGKKPEQPEMKSDEAWLREADALLKSCQGKSDAEIVRAIYARAVEGKRNGTLTNAQIDAFYAQFSPMLDGVKRRRLKKLVEELKKM